MSFFSSLSASSALRRMDEVDLGLPEVDGVLVGARILRAVFVEEFLGGLREVGQDQRVEFARVGILLRFRVPGLFGLRAVLAVETRRGAVLHGSAGTVAGFLVRITGGLLLFHDGRRRSSRCGFLHGLPSRFRRGS